MTDRNHKTAWIRNDVFAGKPNGYATTVEWEYYDINGIRRTGRRTNYLRTYAQARRFCIRYQILDQFTQLDQLDRT